MFCGMAKIHVAVARVPGTGVDTPEDPSAFALKCANFDFTTLQPILGGVSYRYDFPQFFFQQLIHSGDIFILALIMKAVAL